MIKERMGVGSEMREEGAGDSPTTSRLDSYLTALTRGIEPELHPLQGSSSPQIPRPGLRGAGGGEAGTVGKFS